MIETVFEVGLKLVDVLKKTQSKNLKDAANAIAKAHAGGHKFFVTGSGHSHCVAEELYARAGTLAFTIPILTPELTLVDHPTKSTYLERLSGYAKILVDLYGISQGDVLLICSNSGRNAYPVEMALEAKMKGATVIAITNLKHSKSVSARHECGKRLFELADIVIDNCGEIGDSATPLEGTNITIFPTSSIANSFICACINAEVCEELQKMGKEVTVFVSSNVDGGDDKNRDYFKKYTRLYNQL